ncbi:MAG: hypothetical protein AAF617_01335 [Bacteroidota bacterium]
MKKLTVIILTICCVFGCTEMNQTENLRAQIDRLKIKNDSLTKIVMTEKKPAPNYWYDDEYEGLELMESGITNPTKFIEESLRKNTELIPLEAVLGGTMVFENIQILGKEWLIASFEDGHIQGRAIYKFTLTEKGELKFQVLHSTGAE